MIIKMSRSLESARQRNEHALHFPNAEYCNAQPIFSEYNFKFQDTKMKENRAYMWTYNAAHCGVERFGPSASPEHLAGLQGWGPALMITVCSPNREPVYSTLKAIHQFTSNWSPDSSSQLVITFGHSLPRLFNTHVNISFINCSNVYLLKTPLRVHQTVIDYQLNNMHFLKGLAA